MHWGPSYSIWTWKKSSLMCTFGLKVINAAIRTWKMLKLMLSLFRWCQLHPYTWNKTHRNKEFFNLLQSVTHSGIRFGRRCEHLDQHMEIFVKVMILCFSALSQFFFLLTDEKRNIYTHLHTFAALVKVQESEMFFFFFFFRKYF